MEPISTNNAAEQTEAAAPVAAAAVIATEPVAQGTDDSQNGVETATQTAPDTETTQTTEQTEKTTSSPVDYKVYVGFAIVGVLLIVLIARLLRKKSKKGPNGKPNGKSSNPDMVEIYVGNLSYDMTDAQLRREFERFGVVKTARVITHRTNGKSKGYGFIEMPHRKEAGIAIKALDNSDVMGRKLRVNEARANTRPPER